MSSLTYHLAVSTSPAAIQASKKMITTFANALTMAFEDYLSRRAKNVSVAERAMAAVRLSQTLLIAQQVFVSTAEDLLNEDLDVIDAANATSEATASILRKKLEQWYVEATPPEEVNKELLDVEKVSADEVEGKTSSASSQLPDLFKKPLN